MFHGNDLNAQRNLCGSGDLNAQRIFRGNGDLKVFEGQRKCDLVKLGGLQQDLVKLVLLRWRGHSDLGQDLMPKGKSTTLFSTRKVSNQLAMWKKNS